MTELFISEIIINKNTNGFDPSRYPFSLPAVRCLDRLVLKNKVTFLAGENGTGKSTLLEAIAVSYGFNPEGGSKNFSFSTMDTHSDLYRFVTFVKGSKHPNDGFFLRAESFYNMASWIDESQGLTKSYGGKSLHEISHGESFFALIKNRFWGNGLYILDEPEAALSPQRQLALIAQIAELVKSGSQFIIATHSPMLLAYPDAEIFVLDENGITSTPYKETEHYIIARQFLNNPDGMLKYLLAD